jgi:hypothetical protein
MSQNPRLDIISEFQDRSLFQPLASQRKRFRLHKKEHSQIWVRDAIKCRWAIDNTPNTR